MHQTVEAPSPVRTDEVDVGIVGCLTPSLEGPVGRLSEVDLRPGLLVLAGAAQDEKLVDHLREPVHLRHPRIEPLGSWVAVRGHVAHLLELQPQPGERRTQLVGGVGDEVALTAKQP